VFNHQAAVDLALRLLEHLRLSAILPDYVLERFSGLQITSPIRGFYSTQFPLWKLGYFLGEEWLQDSVLDGLAEMQYFKTGATSAPLDAPPTFLFLPTSFLSEARLLYSQNGTRGYSRELRALRERIQHTAVSHIGFLNYSTYHYSSYVLESSRILEYGDSLHGDPADDILPILRWLLSGLGVDLPTDVRRGIMDHQGVGGGDGSCAIAAHNFVACRMDSTIERWMARSSWKVRDSLLRELCLYHHVALGAVGVCVFLLMELNLLSQCSHSMIGWSRVLGDRRSHSTMWWTLEGMMISIGSGQK
jgi:hypothetical protein